MRLQGKSNFVLFTCFVLPKLLHESVGENIHNVHKATAYFKEKNSFNYP